MIYNENGFAKVWEIIFTFFDKYIRRSGKIIKSREKMSLIADRKSKSGV